MNIKFYKNESINNELNKTITLVDSITGTFKSDVDIINPILNIKLDSLPSFNYCYIEELKRYYFVENIEFVNNNVYKIYLKLDVLFTYKDDILKGYGVSFENTNSNMIDSNNISLINKEYEIYKSSNLISVEDVFILATLGGGSSV